MPAGEKPAETTCAVCLGRKRCVTQRTLNDLSVRFYDNFVYSEDHKGWLCKPCAKRLETKESRDRDFADYILNGPTPKPYRP